MKNMHIESMVTENMESIGTSKESIRKCRYKIAKAIIAILAVLNILVIFICPEVLLRVLKIEEHGYNNSSSIDQGDKNAVLRVNEEKRIFDGNGIFDPMESVEAFDVNGEDIRDKVAVTYVPGPTIEEKRILYTVYDSNSSRLEASSLLVMNNYHGPSITVSEVESVSWEELQNLTEVLIERKMIDTDDGFGNACPNRVSYSYNFDPMTASAEITFSLSNAFQDYTNKKMRVLVNEIPKQYLQN